VTGHSDGVVRFIEGDLVLANDYRLVDGCYRTELRRSLRRGGLKVIDFAYRPRTPSAFGCFANFLRVTGVVIVPGLASLKTKKLLAVFSDPFQTRLFSPLIALAWWRREAS
jgi:hypothetical protein